MMKKLLCTAAVLLVLLTPLAAMAEGVQTYAAKDGSLSFAYPTDWMVLSRDTIDAMMEATASMEDVKALVESVRPQIEQSNLVIVMNSDGTANVNLLLQDVEAELTGDDLLSMAPAIQQSLKQQIDTAEFADEPALTTLGNRQAMLLQWAYTLADIDFAAIQAYMPMGTDLVTCTLTLSAFDDALIESALGVLEMMLTTLEAA